MSLPPTSTIGSQGFIGDRALSPGRVSGTPGSGIIYSNAAGPEAPRTIRTDEHAVPVGTRGSSGFWMEDRVEGPDARVTEHHHHHHAHHLHGSRSYGTLAPPIESTSDWPNVSKANLYGHRQAPRTEEERRAFESAAESSRFQWVRDTNSWALFKFAMALVGHTILALILLFWALMTEHEYLMRCDGPFSTNVAYTCQWTKAFLRAFPLLALNVSVVVAFRILLQTRMYYTSLQLKGLLDFVDARILQNPLFWALVVSLAHGVVHFILKIVYTEDDPRGKLQIAATIVKSFIVPALLFLTLFYHSADIERHLIPLNKYFEEDIEYSKRTLGHITAMDERVVHHDVWQRDVVASTGVKQPTLFQVVQNIIDNYNGAASHWLARYQEHKTVTHSSWSWFHGFWPGRVLLNPRLHNSLDSVTKQTVAVIKMALFVTLVVVLISAFLGLFAIYRAFIVDRNMGWQRQYILTYIVYFLHVLFLIYLFAMVWKNTHHTSHHID